MLIALLALPALALLLLAAHLVHAGLLPLAAPAILAIGLLLVRRPWAARVVQAILLVATIEWILTTVGLAMLRARHDQPYLRLALILGAVTLFTALAGLALEHRTLRAWFGRGPRDEAPAR